MVRIRVGDDVEEAYRRLLRLEYGVPEPMIAGEDAADVIRWYARLESESHEEELSDLDLSA
jgi:hypothetical protein